MENNQQLLLKVIAIRVQTFNIEYYHYEAQQSKHIIRKVEDAFDRIEILAESLKEQMTTGGECTI